MVDLLNLKIEQMAGLNFKCECGRTHKVDIEKIIVGSNILNDKSSFIDIINSENLFVVADKNTYKSWGKELITLLKRENYQITEFIFQNEDHLIPNEKSVGRLLIEIPKNTSLIIGVGSGTINDLCRFLSHKLNIPYVIFATAPSMDGYASMVSPLIVEGFKKTYEATYAKAIVSDTQVLRNAPLEMIHAGFGDILGKFTSLTDWKLSKLINNEYYCEKTVEFVEKARDLCVKNAEKISQRSEEVTKQIMEALIISGVAIGFVGYSRPASGAEHHLAHYWEMDAISKNIPHPLHGNSVGVGTVVVSMIYQLMKDKLPTGLTPPDPEYLISIHKMVGSIYNPKELGIPKDVFQDSIIHAREIRNRYTIFQLAHEFNLLEKISTILTEKFYG